MKIANPNVLKLLDINGKLLGIPEEMDLIGKDRSKEFDLDYLNHLIINDTMLPFYKSTIWLHTRKDILERDKYECQLCKTRGSFTILRKNAYIHHMAELKLFPQYCLNYNNIVTLCWSCHEETHERFQFSPEIEEVYENFDSTEAW